MCGIWALLFRDETSQIRECYSQFMKLKQRGPDRSHFIEFDNVKVGFHRLAIMDTSIKGDQPFVLEVDNMQVYALCNGEIYNYKELIDRYKLETKSGSDCEVIPLLFIKLGMEKMLKELIGEYAITIVTKNLETNEVSMYIARDEFGIRPIFYCQNENSFNISSELKGLIGSPSPRQFPPRHFGYVTLKNGCLSPMQLTEYHSLIPQHDNMRVDYDQIKLDIHDTLVEAVRCRLSADREIGCLLSGGLDSSLVASIAARVLKEQGKVLKTFSIGLVGSTDEPYAKLVADFIGSEHTHIQLNEQEWLDAISDVVYATETYDITTVRASTGQYLASKKIFELTGIKTLLNGDGSDEQFVGYIYNKNAPSALASHLDTIRLLSNIHFFDGLRVDRGIASNGIEARVPFLDRRLVSLTLSISPELKVPQNNVEKSLLRESFNLPDNQYLPYEVLFRTKEAFSDGVSSKTNSWFQIIQNFMEHKFTDDDLERAKHTYHHCTPLSKEALYYRQLFEQFFGQGDEIAKVIPYYWLPMWSGDIQEPSARVLSVYKSSDNTSSQKDTN